MLFSGGITYVYVNASGLMPTAEFSRIELLDINGTFLHMYKLNRSEANSSVYIAEPFILPSGYFYVKVGYIIYWV